MLSLLGSYWPTLVGILCVAAGGVWGLLGKRKADAQVAQAQTEAARVEVAAAQTQAQVQTQVQTANAEAAQAGAQRAAVANQAAAKVQTLGDEELDAMAASLGVLRKEKP